MFDVGFWELGLIAVVALVVVGPERLPGLARKVGLYVGKAQRMISSVKAEVNQEIAASELKKHLANQADGDDEFDFIEDTKKSLNEAKDALNEVVKTDLKESTSPSPADDELANGIVDDAPAAPEKKTQNS